MGRFTNNRDSAAPSFDQPRRTADAYVSAVALSHAPRGARAQLVSVVQAGRRRIAVDLDGVDTLDLNTLTMLEEAGAAVREAGGELVLMNAGPTVAAVIELVRLDHMLGLDTADSPGSREHENVAPACAADATTAVATAKTQRWRWLALATGLLLIVATLGACARNSDPPKAGSYYMPEKGGFRPAAYVPDGDSPTDARPAGDDCAPAGTANFLMHASKPDFGIPDDLLDPPLRHSPGDRIRVRIEDDDDFAGTYVINADGRLPIPYLSGLKAAGLTSAEIEADLREELVRGGYFPGYALEFSVEPLQWAPIQVTVSGAVFQPGRTLINQIPPANKTTEVADVYGDSPSGRFLAAALRGASGVRPDADLSAVTLMRGGIEYRLDLRGILTGDQVPDVPLVAGDRIHVPQSPCFQSALVRPSQITPDGIRVFMSNLTAPASSNSGSGIGQYATNVPYGTRMLRGLISANCVGGAFTNEGRRAVLVSTNFRSGETEVIERSVEDLVRNQSRDAFNPHLMPNDGLACYDSAVTNLREIARTFTDLLSPFTLVRIIRQGL